VIESMPEYGEAFQKAFPGEKHPVTFDNLAKAIGAFERKFGHGFALGQVPGREDQAAPQRRGEGRAEHVSGCRLPDLSQRRLYGRQHVPEIGLGEALGECQRPRPFLGHQAGSRPHGVQGAPLRNIEKTAPYYHDGSIATLEDAVRQMADHQLARTLTKEEAGSIASFLKALTGELPTEYIKEPPLPKSTGTTPKPGRRDGWRKSLPEKP